MGIRSYFKLDRGYPPELICFDHLYSEYLTIKTSIGDDEAKSFIDNLHTNRNVSAPSWNDLYYFELILARDQPVEKLRSKVIRLRYDYRSVAGQQKFDAYLASKPPDLQSPPEPTDPPHATQEHYEKLLREDLKDLLGRIYLEYAVLPVKEKNLNKLTWVAGGLCLLSLIVLLGILAVLFWMPTILEISSGGETPKKINTLLKPETLSSATIFVVVVAGAMGGFVSALQRIQSTPTEGNSIYNLSLLFHGANSVFVAPISGAIFAILLYLMFTAGILQGTFFPAIFTPPAIVADSSTNQSQNPSNADKVPVNQQANSNSNPQTSAADANSTKKEAKQGLNVLVFLAESGPKSGEDYALLIIWCFIAGFAERFVPDTLDRLISKNNSHGNNRA
jgi:hypothetical protein